MSTIATKPLRADARRNRRKVLAAASAAFAEMGLDAQIEDIARRASVGVGTVYRHFPTKDVLVAALAIEHFERLADIVEECAREGEPWDAMAAGIWRCAETTVGDIALCEILGGQPGVLDAAAVGKRRLEAAIEKLIDAARAQGTIRADATLQDVGTIMCGFGHIAAAQRTGNALDWRRYVTIALDGLRAR